MIYSITPKRDQLRAQRGTVLLENFLYPRKHKGDRDAINVRFGPLCGLKSDISRGPRSAISCREQVQQNARQKARLTYSMTSSAIARTPGGIVTPSALAVGEAG
jgi:hypothetical protein